MTDQPLPGIDDLAVAKRVAKRILEKWGASSDNIPHILGDGLPLYDEYDSGSERISLILNLHATLRTMFDNPENIAGFMQEQNHNPYFNGQLPIDLISKGNITTLREVYRRLDGFSRSGGW